MLTKVVAIVRLPTARLSRFAQNGARKEEERTVKMTYVLSVTFSSSRPM